MTHRLRPLLVALVALFALGVAVAVPAGADDPTTSTTVVDPTTTTVAPDPAPPVEPAPPAPVIKPAPTWADFVAFFRSLLPPIPDGSGNGRRIVYSVTRQRVWLVGDGNFLEFSYAVSGRALTPGPGVYSIYSKSRYASSGSARMQYMMRFAHGRSLAIGFHSIPTDRRGRPMQSEGQLGSYQSHGCVRQAVSDALLAWNWAPVGTTVVVLR